MQDEDFQEKLARIQAASTPNSREVAFDYAEILQVEQCKEYVFHGMELSWECLSREYGYLDDGSTPLVERVTSPRGNTPFDLFINWVDIGLYPPPEVMLCIADCFSQYRSSRGDKSLDEIFFGAPHKKRSNPAYATAHYTEFLLFHIDVKESETKPERPGENLQSLEVLAEKYLSSPNNTSRGAEDVDSFLRRYRRWKQRYKSLLD